MSAGWWYAGGAVLAVAGGVWFVASTIAWAAVRYKPRGDRR